jgi:hypothetical protein
MTRWGILAAAAIVFCAVASQLLIPTLGERRVESRLTENGGTAEVKLGAIPALRLLFGDGERFEVTASELELELDRSERVFERLDGFSIVDISIAESIAGPIELDAFELSRDGDGPYRFVAQGETTASGLADFGLEAVDVPGESVIDAFLEPIIGESDLAVPIDLDAELASADGRVQVVSGGGEVGGVPAGPLAQLITAAIVVRL